MQIDLSDVALLAGLFLIGAGFAWVHPGLTVAALGAGLVLFGARPESRTR